jgi:hypothetical protein
MNAGAVPCPDITRNSMPSATAPSHAPTPAGHSRNGCNGRPARPAVASQPPASPARNGHAVEATPIRPSPWLARPMITNASTQATSRTTASHAERIRSP